MAWIESHQTLERHPKTLNLASQMQWELDTAIGKLHRFWWWCVDYVPDGDLRRFTDAQLALAVGVDLARAKAFVDAMINCGGISADGKPLSGFIERQPYFRVHDWWDYFGTFLQIKYKRTPERWQKIKSLYVNGACNGDDNGANNGDCTPIPNLTVPNQPNLTTPTAPYQENCNIEEAPPPLPKRMEGNNEQFEQTTAPEINWNEILANYIGRRRTLSPGEWKRFYELEKEFGSPALKSAVERLHSGVSNVIAFLEHILRDSGMKRIDREIEKFLKQYSPTGGNSNGA